MIRSIGVKAIGINCAVSIDVNEGTGQINFIRYMGSKKISYPCNCMAIARGYRKYYLNEPKTNV